LVRTRFWSEDPKRRPGDDMALEVEGIVERNRPPCIQRKRTAPSLKPRAEAFAASTNQQQKCLTFAAVASSGANGPKKP
jgi:hypothetical protein